MYYWLTVFSPRAVNFSLGSLSTNWKYRHSQSASWNDFRGPFVRALPHPSRVSLARARSLFRPLLPSACYPKKATFVFLLRRLCGSGIRGFWNPESRERLGSGIQVPLTKTATRYLESGIPCLESRIHDCLRFVYSGWKIFVSVVGLTSIWSWAIKNCEG